MLEQVAEKNAEVVGRHAMEVGEREHAARELGRGELALPGERGERLVAEQAVGQAVQVGWLDPALLSIELDERDALQQLPRDSLRQERAGLRLLLAHDEPHLGRRPAPARASHALQEA